MLSRSAQKCFTPLPRTAVSGMYLYTWRNEVRFAATALYIAQGYNSLAGLRFAASALYVIQGYNSLAGSSHLTSQFEKICFLDVCRTRYRIDPMSWVQ